jgi:tetratricopeptide (TPR) repeat protein/serine/threonine protein kinase
LEGKTAAVQSRKSRAMRESEIAMRLRYTEENNDPWILLYAKPIQKNNTLYTIIATEKGEMLSERISDGYYAVRDFTVLCDCILAILDALEPIHDKGYLHLDISPDNIHCSKLNIMRMIDYNSAYSPSDPSGEFFPSVKRGYSAPELKGISNAKSLRLNPATDLFSVAAIFFTMLKGRPIEENDWAIPSRWFLNNEEGYLKGASTLLIDSTNAFLQKNLSRNPKLRLQSVAEMRAKIEELKRLRQRVELENSPKRPNVHFVCREKEISDIDEYLQRDSYVILEGIGGIGKTELAKKYAWENREKYDIVQFITYSGDLQTTVAYSMKFRNFDNAKIAQYESKYGNEAVKHIFSDKMSSLKQDYHGKRTLIVVDNYNTVTDDHFTELVSGAYKVIFTSREKHNGNTIEIKEITDERDLLELFSEYYAPDKLADEQVSVVLKIIGLVLGHTMTLMLIATAMQKSMKTPAEMLTRLQNSLDPKLRTKIAVDKEGISAEERENVVYGHVRNLFNMEEIIANEAYCLIMTNMAIIPHTGVDKKTFYLWALSEHYKCDEYDDEDYTDLDSLIDHRWIQYDGETHYVSLHPVISDLAYRELKPDSVKCRKLIEGMIDSSKNFDDETHIEQVAYTELLDLAVKRIGDESDVAAELVSRFAQLNEFLARHSNALEYYKKLAVICEILYSNENPTTAIPYHKIGDIYTEQGEYSKAMEWHQKALTIRENIFGTEHPETANTYNSIAMVLSDQGDYPNALSLQKRVLMICENMLGAEHPHTASAYNNIAAIYSRQGDYANSLLHYKKSMVIREKVYGVEHRITATAYNNIGFIYSNQENLVEALSWYQKALIIRENVLGKEHPDTATSYNNIAGICESQGDYINAMTWYLKSLAIRESVLGKEHPETAMVYNNIAYMHDSQKDYINALEWYQKALNVNKNKFGEEHPLTAQIYNNIAAVYNSQGEYSIALDLYSKVLVIREKLLGSEHSSVAITIHGIGAVYDSKGDYVAAIEWYQRALSIFELKYGENHPRTIKAYTHIANAYEQLGERHKAKEYRQKASRKENDKNE